MKIEVYETTKIKKKIEVDFPYFFEHDMMLDRSDRVMYGVYISPKLSFEITIHKQSNGDEECEIEKSSGICDSYLTKEHKSTKENFMEALKKAESYTNQIKDSLGIVSNQKILNFKDNRIKLLRKELNKISDALIPKQIFTSSEHQTNMILHEIRDLQVEFISKVANKAMSNNLQKYVEVEILKKLSYQEINHIMNTFNDTISSLDKEVEKLKADKKTNSEKLTQ